MGCGKNGSFSPLPDARLCALFLIDYKSDNYGKAVSLPKFIEKWLQFFGAEVCTISLQPINGHGSWDGKMPFANMDSENKTASSIAVLTRASIKKRKLFSFWKQVPAVEKATKQAKGLIFSLGMGEIPFIRQATFSIWEDVAHLKQFAYQGKAHHQVISQSKVEDWYSEQLFFRFVLLKIEGSIAGIIPLIGNP